MVLEESKAESEDVELALMHGHNMRQDGIADANRLKAYQLSSRWQQIRTEPHS